MNVEAIEEPLSHLPIMFRDAPRVLPNYHRFRVGFSPNQADNRCAIKARDTGGAVG